MKVQRSIGIILFTALIMITPFIALARAGGGGSGGGGGGGGGGGSHSGGGRGCSFQQCPVQNSIIFGIFILFFIGTSVLAYKQRQAVIAAKKAKIAEADAELATAEAHDALWNKDKLIGFTHDLFLEFQRAWGVIDVPALAKILTPDMHKRIALELAVLSNEGRRNPTEITEIIEQAFIGVHDDSDDTQDSFSILFTARADDRLIQVDSDDVIFEDNSSFTETWDFVRDGNSWKLAAIHQATEDANALIPSIQAFSVKNGFYYNPDFGWLMLPNKGALFHESRFGNTDINNHVIGYFRDKIVEFYTMDVWKNKNNNEKTSYLIAQAILPIHHNDILVRRKHMFQFTPSGMVKHEMESNEFIKEFQVCSDPNDNMETFELLTPNFMEMIMKLPFELTMEVVGNTLYLATELKGSGLLQFLIAGQSTEDAATPQTLGEHMLFGDANYDKMLEILSYAFDEMKM